MEGYIKCQVCGKPLKVINAAHLKTHNMTLEKYNEFVQCKKSKREGNSEDIFLKWLGSDNKIGIISISIAIIALIVTLYLFFLQKAIIPNVQVKTKESILKGEIQRVKLQIAEREVEIDSLDNKIEKVKQDSISQKYIEYLENEIIKKRTEIEYLEARKESIEKQLLIVANERYAVEIFNHKKNELKEVFDRFLINNFITIGYYQGIINDSLNIQVVKRRKELSSLINEKYGLENELRRYEEEREFQKKFNKKSKDNTQGIRWPVRRPRDLGYKRKKVSLLNQKINYKKIEEKFYKSHINFLECQLKIIQQFMLSLPFNVKHENLIKYLNNENWRIRFYSAYNLGKMTDSLAVIPLIKKIINDDNIYVRQMAIRALGEIGDTTVIKPLIDLVLHDLIESNMRIEALESLMKVGKPVIPHLFDTLKNKELNTRFWVVNALGAVGDSNSLEILSYFSQNDPADWIREQASYFIELPNDLSETFPYGKKIYSPDGKKYVRELQPDSCGLIGLFDRETNTILDSIDLKQHPSGDEYYNDIKGIVWTIDSKQLAVMFHYGRGGCIDVVDIINSEKLYYFNRWCPIDTFYHHIKFSLDGTKIIAKRNSITDTLFIEEKRIFPIIPHKPL